MPRLTAYLEKLIESGWLLSLVVVPLFFNVYSYRVFEPDKLALFRALATLMAVLAGLLAALRWRRSERHGLSWDAVRSWLAAPLVLPALLTGIVSLLATAWSVFPRASLMGSYQRLQGTYTTLCYLTLFGCVLAYLRHRRQVERALTVIVLTSLPVAMYGLLQHHGLDPLPWQGDVTTRVASTMGNAIFVGAYLIMVIPLTVSRWLSGARSLMAERHGGAPALVPVVAVCLVNAQVLAWAALPFSQAILVAMLLLFAGLLVAAVTKISLANAGDTLISGLVLAVQLVALLFTGSRGPQVGLLGGLVLMALLTVAVSRRRRVAVGVVASGVSLLVLLLVMNLPNSPLASVREVPYVGRLGRLLELDQGTGRVRTLIWEGAVDLLQADPWRAAIGYGPESMYVVYNRYYPAELAHYEARTASPDRSHNEIFDALITTGVPGLAAHLALFVGVIVYGLDRLGLASDRRSRAQLLSAADVGGLLGIVFPVVLDGSLRLSGVGLPIGVIAGIMVYVSIVAMLGRSTPTDLQPWQRALVIALLATVVAHWIEISVGIAIASTRVYFWTYAALLVSVAQWRPSGGPASSDTSNTAPTPVRPIGGRRRAARSRHRQALRAAADAPKGAARTRRLRLSGLGFVLAMIPVTLAWDLIGSTESQDTLLGMLVPGSGPSGGRTSAGLLWLIMTTMLVIVVRLLCDRAPEGKTDTPAGRGREIALAAAIPILATILYSVLLAFGLKRPVEPLALFTGYLVTLAVGFLGVAWTLARDGEPAPVRVSRRMSLALLAVLGATVALVWFANIAPIRADMVYKQGLQYDGAQNWGQAAARYELASEMAPSQDYYLLFAGRARLEQAREVTDHERDALFEAAIDHLQTAHRLSPLNTDHAANLARAYRSWAEEEANSGEAAEHLQRALQHYKDAIALSPQNVQLYNEAGMTLAALGDVEGARGYYLQSLELDDRYAPTYLLLGDLHLDAEEWADAIALYEKAVALTPSSVSALSRLAYAHAQAENWDEAIAANLAVLEQVPEDYITLRNLVYIYYAQQDTETALAYLDQALAVAPEAEAGALRALREQLDR